MREEELQLIHECAYCALPVPLELGEEVYCSQACFDGHVDAALFHDYYLDRMVDKFEPLPRVW